MAYNKASHQQQQVTNNQGNSRRREIERKAMRAKEREAGRQPLLLFCYVTCSDLMCSNAHKHNNTSTHEKPKQGTHFNVQSPHKTGADAASQRVKPREKNEMKKGILFNNKICIKNTLSSSSSSPFPLVSYFYTIFVCRR